MILQSADRKKEALMLFAKCMKSALYAQISATVSYLFMIIIIVLVEIFTELIQ